MVTKQKWTAQATISSISPGFSGRQVVSTFEGLVLVVDPTQDNCGSHALRGIVKEIPVAPHGIDCGKFYGQEVCCGTDPQDGFMHVYTWEPVQ